MHFQHLGRMEVSACDTTSYVFNDESQCFGMSPRVHKISKWVMSTRRIQTANDYFRFFEPQSDTFYFVGVIYGKRCDLGR